MMSYCRHVRPNRRWEESRAEAVRELGCAMIVLAAILAGLGAARAQNVEDFYRSRQMRLIVGFSAGGGYDLMARLAAKYMSRYLPGRPNIVAQNLPGAGSATAAAYLMQQAPRDGSVIATLGQNIGFDQAMDARRSSTFDVSRMGWIGNTDEENNVLAIWRDAGVTSIDDAFKREIVIGATSADGSDALYPMTLNNLLGAKFRIIGGFPGGPEQNLAMERREIDGRGSNTMSSIRATSPHHLAANKLVFILQMGLARDPALPDTPLMLDLARNAAERGVFQLISSGVRVGRPILTTPDVPADRLAALRDAFDKAVRDPEFLSEARAANFDVNPIAGAEVQRVVEGVVHAPDDILALARVATTPGGKFDCPAIVRDKSVCTAP